jgi:hypothetical protein
MVGFTFSDDLQKPNGNIASSVITFGNSWLAYENGSQVGHLLIYLFF